MNSPASDSSTPPTVPVESIEARIKELEQRFPNLQPLARAVTHGDVAHVRQCLATPGTVVDQGAKGTPTPLIIACALERPEILGLLLDAGADPNQHKGLPLQSAVYVKNADCLRLLLERKADPNTANAGGRTALQDAAQLGWDEGVELLIRHGALLEKPDSGGFTPLMLAASDGRLEVVRRLLQAGAAVDASNPAGSTAVSLAAGSGRLEVVRALIESGAMLTPGPDRYSPLGTASGRGETAVVAELLRLGADPNARSKSGGAPLFTAAYNGRVAAMRLLLAAGADPNGRDEQGRTPLMMASWRQFRRCDEILRATGADPSSTAPEGVVPRTVTPIHAIERSKHLPRDPWLTHVFAFFAFLGGSRREILGFSVTVDIDKSKRAQAFNVVERALKLIQRHSPSELGRLKRAFRRIMVAEVGLFQAAYLHDKQWCVLNWDSKAKKAPLPSRVAALFVHEATHHRLHQLGFGFRQADQVRLERACSRAALRFARHLPGSSGVKVVSEHLHGITPESLSHEEERRKARQVMNDAGAPRWAIRIGEWFLRLRQRRQEKG